MGWTAWIPELPLEPAEAVLQQRDGLQARCGGSAGAGVIAGQQLHQGSADLLGRPPRPLLLMGVPLVRSDAEAAMQGLGLLQGLRRPLIGAGRLGCP